MQKWLLCISYFHSLGIINAEYFFSIQQCQTLSFLDNCYLSEGFFTHWDTSMSLLL